MSSISKSVFKARALEFFRQVEATGVPLVITDRGRPVLRLVPFEEDRDQLLASFRGSVRRYDSPLAPVGDGEWEAQS